MTRLFPSKLEGPQRCTCRQYKTNFSSFQGISAGQSRKSCIFAEINSSAPSGAFSQPSFHTPFQVVRKIPGPVPLSKTVFFYVLRFNLYVDFFFPSLRIIYAASMTEGAVLWGENTFNHVPSCLCLCLCVGATAFRQRLVYSPVPSVQHWDKLNSIVCRLVLFPPGCVHSSPCSAHAAAVSALLVE